MAIRTNSFVIAAVALALSANSSFAGDPARTAKANLQTIQSILSAQDSQIDLTTTKLTIDHMVNPTINVNIYLKRIDTMVSEIKAMMPKNPSSLQKMGTLVAYIYQPGAWNNYSPYRYDLNDPLGKNIRNKLLPTYLTTRKGNSVTMPFLFLILGQKIGIEMTASTLPEHNFVKYRLDDNMYMNFEATSGSPKLDSSYRRDVPMTDQAIQNGIYMRPLSKKETVALMANVLLEHYMQQGQYEDVITLSDTLLKYAPNDVTLMLYMGSASGMLEKRKFTDIYPNPNAIPADKRQFFDVLKQNNALMLQQAESLGWRESDTAPRQYYIR